MPQDDKLIRKAKKGDLEAINILFHQYKYLIIYIASKFRVYNNNNREDLSQQAFLAFLKALKKYQFKKGKFSTYLYWWLQKYIREYVDIEFGEENNVDELEVYSTDDRKIIDDLGEKLGDDMANKLWRKYYGH